MTTTLALSSAPSIVGFEATGILYLRNADLQLRGYYSKTDWRFTCRIENFDLASLRDLYEDLFGDKLHLSDHEIVLNELDF